MSEAVGNEESGAAGVEISLFAPRVHKVVLQGEWNGFAGDEMVRGEEGVWRATLPLADGNYGYRFEVTYAEGQPAYQVADPLAMRYKADDMHIAVVDVADGRQAWLRHEWKHNDVPLPTNDALVIYELHIGDFGGTFTGVVERLDYLADLGITAIELMPVTQASYGDNWGYSQYSLYAANSRFGTPDELAYLVDEAHGRGIRVITDGVYNHMATDAPIHTLDSSYWFYAENPDPPELQFGPKFNYEAFDEDLHLFPAREHTLGAINRWVSALHMDGIRFDATRALKYFDIIDWFNDEAHNRVGFKPFFTIAEHIPQDPAITGPDHPVDAAWHDSLRRQLAATVTGTEVDGNPPFDTSRLLNMLDGRNEGFVSNINLINYMNNHDEERLMHKLGSAANLYGEDALRRLKLGATILLTAPGIPMLWMGEEFGQATPRGGPGEPHPLDWSLLGNEGNAGLHAHYRFLINLRKELAPLRSDTFAVVLDDPARGVIAFKRWAADGGIVIVAANLKDADAGAVALPLDGIEPDDWQEAIHNEAAHIEDGRIITTLAQSEAKVFIKR